MKNALLKLSCFITGFNYSIVRNCSEMTTKLVKRYFSAILIISIIWAIIGFSFTERYLRGGFWEGIAGAVVLVFIVIQIERQIILSIGSNNWQKAFRVVIGVLMAFLGAIIIDQIIFKEDIEKRKVETVQQDVNRLLPIETGELKNQITQIDSSLIRKEAERQELIAEITAKPTISIPAVSVKYETDTLGVRREATRTVNSNSSPNPKIDLLPDLNQQIKDLQTQKTQKENEILSVRQDLAKRVSENIGFIDELNIISDIIFSSGIAIFVYAMLFLFFLMLELFVLMTKSGTNEIDYDSVVKHQMKVKLRLLEALDVENKTN